MQNKTVILVAVRLKSKRLKKKALSNLFGKPLILCLTERIRKSNLSSEIVWCTSTSQEDDELVGLGKENRIEIFRGSENDVMSRFILAAEKYNAENIVRVTGDNPLTDPEVIDFLVKQHIKNKMEYTVCNSTPPGTRSEVIDLKMLKKCHGFLQDPDSSEYMTWMLNRPNIFKTLEINYPNKKLNRPDLRLTVDYEEDLKNIQKIYDYYKGKLPSLEKIIQWIDTQNSLLTNLRKKRKVKRPKEININFKPSIQ